MKLLIRFIFRLILSIPVLLIFGIMGLLKHWRFGGGISVNVSDKPNEIQALEILENKIAEYKAIKKESE